MLRPERMSKVSIAGAKSVMEDAIGVLHDLELLHIEDYDERWEDFSTGDPLEHAETASERLVVIRALENTLDLDPAEVHPEIVADREEAVERLEEVRKQVTDLEDERNDITDELRQLRDERERLKPLATLGIDLDLLHGYDAIEIAVGEGTPEAVDRALDASDAIEAYELFDAEGVVAIAARPAADETGAVSDALVGVDFAGIEVPEESGDPTDRRDELNRRIQQLEHELEQVDAKLESLKIEHGGFLLALEEELSIEVEQAEAPLHFATTPHSFIAEGWVPTRRVPDLQTAMTDAVGDLVDVDELEQVSYDPPHEHEVSADGGRPELHEGEPPVIQNNPSILKPFEVFVTTINRPHYHELDPTLFIFLTFPLAFGFMIGDIGYGLFYVLMGLAVHRLVTNDSLKALGTIAIWAGGFTILFGYLYDEMFGIHIADLGLELPLAGVFSKGLQIVEVAQLWIVVSILFGVLHLSTGYFMGFLNDRNHGLGEAFTENGAWLLVLWGIFAWIFTSNEVGETPAFLDGIEVAGTDLGAVDFTVSGIKPEFLVGYDGVLYRNEMFDLGFAGLSPTIAVIALLSIIVGAVLVFRGEGAVGIIELPTNAFGHAVSYIRLMAVLLAKAGMAFSVNLLVWGGYESHGYVAFNLPTYDVSGYTEVFPGLVHIDPLFLSIPLAIFVFVAGHVLVLLLGITAAGIQMTRLEYVEFFGKFYDGGGGKFEPFGYKRAITEEK